MTPEFQRSVLGSVSMSIVIEVQQNRYETMVIPIYIDDRKVQISSHAPAYICISQFM